MDFTAELNGCVLEYFDDEHLYLVDGVVVPSVTQMLRKKFGGKYAGVNTETLRRAAEAGTALHEAVERYCINNEESDLKELKNYKFLQRKYQFKVMRNEVPVILFDNDVPVCAGRLDMVIQLEDGQIAIADIKRTSALDKEYLAYQLNLYRLAYQQCYKTEITALRGIHLREDVRKFVTIPINEEIVKELINE